ncbi:hypothetical protein BH23ACT9_BH23ACT9_09720 [soil metagenome]
MGSYDGGAIPRPIAGVTAPRDLSLEGAVRPLVTALRHLTGLDVTYLTEILWDDEVQHIRVSDASGTGVDIPEGLTVPWPDTLCRRAMESGEMAIDDAPRRWADSDAAAMGIQSYVSCPVVVDDSEQPWGTLCAASGRPQTLTEPQREVLCVFADTIADLVRQHRDQQRERQRTAKDRATLARRTGLLLTAERELIAPLTAARGWAATLLRPDLDSERREEVGRGLLAQLDILWNRTNALWTEGHLVADTPIPIIKVDLAATVRGAVTSHRATLGTHPVEITGPHRVEALGDVDVIGGVLSRLFDNINLHTPMDTPVEIVIADQPPRVTVRDHGPGWPQPMPEQVLTTTAPLVGGGIGLFTAAGLAETIGATLAPVMLEEPGVALVLQLQTPGEGLYPPAATP